MRLMAAAAVVIVVVVVQTDPTPATLEATRPTVTTAQVSAVTENRIMDHSRGRQC